MLIAVIAEVHGNMPAQHVPFLASPPFGPDWRVADHCVKYYDIFDVALNGAVA